MGTVFLLIVVIITKSLHKNTLPTGLTSFTGWVASTLGAAYVLIMTILMPTLGAGSHQVPVKVIAIIGLVLLLAGVFLTSYEKSLTTNAPKANIWQIIWALIAGALSTTQGLFNGQLSAMTRANVAGILSLGFGHGNIWLLGGVMGAAFITSIIILFPILGPINAVIYPTLGQIFSGLIYDWTGALFQRCSVTNQNKKGDIMFYLIGILSGLMLAVQNPYNSNFGKQLASPIAGGFMVYVLGTIEFLLLLLITIPPNKDKLFYNHDISCTILVKRFCKSFYK
ncbi:DMT family transporter [Weissella confusa]|uniref:DMT family transporter n=1 Tax=Weissella confusa TaxID=1583 RepID=A0A923NF89_WEICO|nr:DMT family transporter [Weissella confusa]